MNRLQEIEARLAAINSEVETRGAELTAEQITALNTEVDALKAERAGLITANDQRAALLANIAEGRAAGATATPALPTPTAGGGERRTADPADPTESMEYRKAFMNYVLRGTKIPAELRADAITNTGQVGSVIPAPVLNKIIEKIEAVGMILPLTTRTAYIGGLNIPTSTAKPVASWVAEGAGSDKQNKPTGVITFNYHKLRCAVAVTLEVDTMALSAFEMTLINNVVEAMTKALEQAIISGDGIGKPKGILTETPATGQALTTAAPKYEDLTNMEAALPIEYENGAVWCMTKKTFMSFVAMTDATGQPIARVDYGISGKPARTLLGRAVVLCNYLPSFVAGLPSGTAFAFLFDFKDYIVNTNYAMGVKRYEDDDTDDRITRALMLVDGKVVDKNSLVTLSIA
ncbi:MAG: phage major capsid protein [Defluviitaleaceae bacterium]|nr:phage major capsid protein [Defluviitaleaceae bacterium]